MDLNLMCLQYEQWLPPIEPQNSNIDLMKAMSRHFIYKINPWSRVQLDILLFIRLSHYLKRRIVNRNHRRAKATFSHTTAKCSIWHV
jgi:hypothetical protein